MGKASAAGAELLLALLFWSVMAAAGLEGIRGGVFLRVAVATGLIATEVVVVTNPLGWLTVGEYATTILDGSRLVQDVRLTV